MTIAKRSLTNARVARLPASGIRRFFDLAATLEGAISLGVGEPDFMTPDAFRDAAIRSIRDGKTQYTSNYGLLALREAIAAHTEQLHGVSYAPVGEILVTGGVSEAGDLAPRPTLNAWAEVQHADRSHFTKPPARTLPMAGAGRGRSSSGRSRSNRPTSSAAKCCASAADPPLPHDRILPSANKLSVNTAAARAMAGANSSAAASFSCALSAKWLRMRFMCSIIVPGF
mgnify:CR=1 FL=1